MLRMIAVCAAMWPGVAGAESVTGNEVLSACNASGPEDGVRRGFCLGYILGAWAGIKFGSSVVVFQAMPEDSAAGIDDTSNQMLEVCVPESVEATQIIDTYTRYLTANPQTRHNSARVLLLNSMREAFPCE